MSKLIPDGVVLEAVEGALLQLDQGLIHCETLLAHQPGGRNTGGAGAAPHLDQDTLFACVCLFYEINAGVPDGNKGIRFNAVLVRHIEAQALDRVRLWRSVVRYR